MYHLSTGAGSDGDPTTDEIIPNSRRSEHDHPGDFHSARDNVVDGHAENRGSVCVTDFHSWDSERQRARTSSIAGDIRDQAAKTFAVEAPVTTDEDHRSPSGVSERPLPGRGSTRTRASGSSCALGADRGQRRDRFASAEHIISSEDELQNNANDDDCLHVHKRAYRSDYLRSPALLSGVEKKSVVRGSTSVSDSLNTSGGPHKYANIYVFVNPNSGGNLGSGCMKVFLRELPPGHACDLSQIKPEDYVLEHVVQNKAARLLGEKT